MMLDHILVLQRLWLDCDSAGGGRERAHALARLFENVPSESSHTIPCRDCSSEFPMIFKSTCYLKSSMKVLMTPFLMAVYAIHPKSMHRFVGYLEETACHVHMCPCPQLLTGLL